MAEDWLELYEGLRAKLGLREKHIMDLGPDRRELFIEATEALRERFVLRVVSGAELGEARAWIRELEACAE
ncbi:MAG: hypothetical protein DRN06_07480, partial [Thermoprotei archaeon]